MKMTPIGSIHETDAKSGIKPIFKKSVGNLPGTVEFVDIAATAEERRQQEDKNTQKVSEYHGLSP